MTVASWNLETGLRIRKHTGHEEVINCLDASKRGQELLLSGSDDGYIGIWDPRQKAAVDFIDTGFPVTGIALSEAGNEIYSGGIDNDIKVWDARKQEVIYTLQGHTDTITSLQISPDSQTILDNMETQTITERYINKKRLYELLTKLFGQGKFEIDVCGRSRKIDLTMLMKA